MAQSNIWFEFNFHSDESSEYNSSTKLQIHSSISNLIKTKSSRCECTLCKPNNVHCGANAQLRPKVWSPLKTNQNLCGLPQSCFAIEQFYGRAKQRMNGIEFFLLIINLTFKRLVLCVEWHSTENDAVISPWNGQKGQRSKSYSICFVWWCLWHLTNLWHLDSKILLTKNLTHTCKRHTTTQTTELNE